MQRLYLHLNKTNQKAETTADKFKRVAGGAVKVGTAVVGMGAAAAAGLTKLATNTAEAGDRVDKMSQKIGLSREGFPGMGLHHVAERHEHRFYAGRHENADEYVR